MKKRHYPVFAVILALGALLLLVPSQSNKNISLSLQTEPEIAKIKSLTNPNDQSKELTKLLDRVGPVQAQEDLLKSGLPFTGQTHLLIHTIGDYIYEHDGLKGLPLCKDYFLSACYHGFLINALGDHGMAGVVGAMTECNKAGSPVAVQCAHATGHGFLAWTDYDLLKALSLCDQAGQKVDNFGYFNCYDGVFMENQWGVHSGEPSPKRWISDTDIYYPCDDPRIPEKYLNGCWSNQASMMFQHFKGDLGKTAEGCSAVENKTYRDTCYNNFYRQIHPLTSGSVGRVFSLCTTAGAKERQNDCILANMSAYWSVGDHDIPFQICSKTSGELKESCWSRLTAEIHFYYPDIAKALPYCDKITDANNKEKCKKQSAP